MTATALPPPTVVIIPAWNEEEVIGRTLDALFDGLDIPRTSVVVACNGCTDGTASIVAASVHPVSLLDLGPVGKAGALRAADETAPEGSHRIYLDADTEISGNSVNAVVALLDGGAAAARPPAAYETSTCTWPVRAFYDVRRDLPSLRSALYGAGVYALSSRARARFDAFPDLVADDLFAARVVGVDETQVAECPPVVVRVPRDTRSLVRTLARVYRGNAELAGAMPELGASSTSATSRELIGLCRSPRRWAQVATYVALVVAGRVAARRSDGLWERDSSSRTASAGRP